MHFFNKKKFTLRKFDFTQNLLEIFNSRRTITLNYIQLAISTETFRRFRPFIHSKYLV